MYYVFRSQQFLAGNKYDVFVSLGITVLAGTFLHRLVYKYLCVVYLMPHHRMHATDTHIKQTVYSTAYIHCLVCKHLANLPCHGQSTITELLTPLGFGLLTQVAVN